MNHQTPCTCKPPRAGLAEYAEVFKTVCVNAAYYYSLPTFHPEDCVRFLPNVHARTVVVGTRRVI
jgi:hypothetical protein